jgi:hypothetical protein
LPTKCRLSNISRNNAFVYGIYIVQSGYRLILQSCINASIYAALGVKVRSIFPQTGTIIDCLLIMPSSVVAHMNYNSDTRILRIIFVSGMIYDYKDVPASIYEAMKTAGSKGTYLNKYIKGHYEFKKIR